MMFIKEFLISANILFNKIIKGFEQPIEHFNKPTQNELKEDIKPILNYEFESRQQYKAQPKNKIEDYLNRKKAADTHKSRQMNQYSNIRN